MYTDIRQLEGLTGDWKRLLERSSHVTAFASPPAILTWYRLTKSHGRVHAVGVWRKDDLEGLAFFSGIRLGLFTLYCTAGAGFGYYGEPLLGENPSATSAVLSQYLARLAQSGKAAMFMRRLRVDGPMLSTLVASERLRVEGLSADEENAVVRFDEMRDVEDYFEARSKKHQIPRLYRRLGDAYEAVDYRLHDPNPGEAIEEMRQWNLERFGHDLRMFATPQNRELTWALSQELVDQGLGRVSSLTLDDRRAAVAIIPQTSSHAIWYAVAYQPELRRYSLGHVEGYEMLNSAYQAGVSEVDLGDAGFDYKRYWANASERFRTVSVTAPGVTGGGANLLRKVATRLHRRRHLSAEGTGPHII